MGEVRERKKKTGRTREEREREIGQINCVREGDKRVTNDLNAVRVPWP